MFLVVVYDIGDNSKRTKISRLLEKFGNRVQKSVFECDLTYSQIDNLKKKLSFFDYDIEDTIRFYFLENSSVKRIEKIGGAKANLNDIYYIV